MGLLLHPADLIYSCVARPYDYCDGRRASRFASESQPKAGLLHPLYCTKVYVVSTARLNREVRFSRQALLLGRRLVRMT